MTPLVIILAALFVALIIIVPLLEKYAKRGDGIDDSRISRYIIPLMAVVLVLAIIRHYMA